MSRKINIEDKKMNIKTKKILALIFCLALILLPSIVFGANMNVKNPLTGTTEGLAPSELYGRIIKAVLALIGVFSLVVVVIAGMMWLTSQGNQEKITRAKTTLAYAGIGLAVVFTSYAILSFVITAFQESL